MLIEIRPGSFINKGGELMARAIVAELGGDAGLVAEPWIAPYPERAGLRLHQKLWVRRLGPAAGLPAALIPGRIRRSFGIVRDEQIDGVLDASGFRYTDDDRHGARSARELERNAGRWGRRGVPVILLPQALGPFRTPAVREPFLRAMASVTLVFARDDESERHLRAVLPGDERIRRAPDITIGLPGRVPDDLERLVGAGPFAAVVPNDRMLERTDPTVAARYPAFLELVCRALADRGLRPVLVLHEIARDRAFVERLRPALGPDPAIVVAEDPLLLKGILGRATVVVSSRFHALVSALSQGVPVVATGWSHKYATLLEDFGVPDQIIDPRAGREELDRVLAVATDGAIRSASVPVLREHAARQSEGLRDMWRTVREALGLPPAPGMTDRRA